MLSFFASSAASAFNRDVALAQTKRFDVLARPLGRRRGANVLPGMLEIRSRVPITAFADLHELTVIAARFRAIAGRFCRATRAIHRPESIRLLLQADLELFQRVCRLIRFEQHLAE